VSRSIEPSEIVTTNNYNSLTSLHTVKITVTTAHKRKSSISTYASRCLVTNLSWLTLHSWTLGFSRMNYNWMIELSWTELNWILKWRLSCEYQSASEPLYDWRFTANQFLLAKSPLRLKASNFIFQLNTCGYSPCVTSSLRRGWICRLQLLLFLASAVILMSESGDIRDHILLSQTRDSYNLVGQVPVFISPRSRVTQL
jgi:hypothetical protein